MASGGGPKKPSAKQTRARLDAARKRRNRTVMVGVLAVVAAVIVVAVVIASSGSSTKSNRPAAVPAGATGPGGSFTTGNGPVLVEEYGDFQCPHCEDWYKTVEQPVVRPLAAQGKITFAYHEFPFIGPESFAEANAAACASDVGKFWPMHDDLYDHQEPENSGAWTTDALLGALSVVGANTPQTSQCVATDKYGSWIKQQVNAAAKRGVTATPTVYVNGKVVGDDSTPGPLEAAIAAASAAPGK